MNFKELLDFMLDMYEQDCISEKDKVYVYFKDKEQSCFFKLINATTCKDSLSGNQGFFLEIGGIYDVQEKSS